MGGERQFKKVLAGGCDAMGGEKQFKDDEMGGERECKKGFGKRM